MILRETESFRDYPVKQKCAGLPAHFFCPASFLMSAATKRLFIIGETTFLAFTFPAHLYSSYSFCFILLHFQSPVKGRMCDLLPAAASGRFVPTPAVVIFLFLDVSVVSLFLDMRDLLPATASGRFVPTPAVVIFLFLGVSVASLFLDMRDLLPAAASGRFAPSSAVVIFYS